MKNKHIHKYFRTKLKKAVVFRCIIPGCNHYIYPAFLVGKISVCHGCESPFIIGKKAATRKKPKCNKCIKEGPHFGNADGREAVRDRDGKFIKIG